MTYNLLFSGDDFRSVDRKLQSLDKIIGAEITGKGSEAVAELVAQEARSIVRVRTGETRRSIRVIEGTGSRRGKPFYVIAGSQEHRAALFLELGTIRQPPYPFLRPAIERASRSSGFKRFVAVTKRRFRTITQRLFGRG